ncbi:hypothetical protein SRHO_G00031390 [Serrasalmus rhombeus]
MRILTNIHFGIKLKIIGLNTEKTQSWCRSGLRFLNLNKLVPLEVYSGLKTDFNGEFTKFPIIHKDIGRNPQVRSPQGHRISIAVFMWLFYCVHQQLLSYGT